MLQDHQGNNTPTNANNNPKNLTINEELINLINILLDSIKEYYKTCRNSLDNKNTLLSSIDVKYNKLESYLSDIILNNIDNNQLNQIIDTIPKLKEISDKLKLYFVSDEKKLTSFFENAKILSKKMKTIHQDNLKNFQKKQNSFYPMRENKLTPKKNTISLRNRTIEISENYLNSTNDNEILTEEKININHNNKSYSKFSLPQYTNKNFNSEKIVREKNLKNSFVLTESDEIKKLKNINKKYLLYIQKLQNDIKTNSSTNDFSTINSYNIKNATFEALLEESKEIKLKYNELLKSYKKIIEENTNLKKYKINNNNQNENDNKFSINNKQQYPNENDLLQKNKEYTNKLVKDIEIINKKLSNTNNQLINERTKNVNIQNTLTKVKNEYKKEMDIKMKKILELSKLLSNKNEELLVLQKKNSEKNNTIENLKNTINNLKLNENNLTNINNNNSKINDYIKQNEQLKLINQSLENTINNYKTQLDNCTNELNNRSNNSENSFALIKTYYETLIKELKSRIKFLENDIANYRESNNKLTQQLETSIQKISSLKKNKNTRTTEINDNNQNNDSQKINTLLQENATLKSEKELLSQKINKLLQENPSLNENNKNNLTIIKEEYEEKLNKKLDEIKGLNQLIYKIQSEREKSDEILKTLKKENENLKKQNNISNQDDNLNKELKEAKNQINSLKKKNEDLLRELDGKEINKEVYDLKSDNGRLSNYEEEFDLRKIVNGVKEKIRSQDINIDYPGYQQIKERYRELDFYYNSLESLVKKLLLNMKCEGKNKTYVTELCKIVGFDEDTTNKIINNKAKKNILGIFQK